jgi:transposase InsO family protein
MKRMRHTDSSLRNRPIKRSCQRRPTRTPSFVRTLREECLDWLLILGRRHLARVLREYVDHYNRERPHRALELRTPSPRHK